MTTTLTRILVLGASLAIAWQSSQRQATDPTPAVDRASAPKVVQGGQFRGMAIQLHGGSDVYDHYHGLIPEIRELGADTVLLVVHGWQTHGGSLDLHIDPRKTAGEEGLGRLCDLAAASGLRVILMPVVLLEHPRSKEWRGKIIPEGQDWDTWFRRYTRFIVHFARIAEKHQVDVLVVGSELIKTEVYTERWNGVIAETRQNYRGALAYSANWDHYQTAKIGFWPQLDYVGMTSYYELAEEANPKREEVDASWKRIKKEILAFAAEVKKPIIFTEVGWCSQEGAAHEGWNYYANQNATQAGQREQSMLYESFIANWASEPAIGGIIWWEWDTSGGGGKDYNYTPRGKLAEGVLRDWFSQRQPLHRGDKPSGTHTGG